MIYDFKAPAITPRMNARWANRKTIKGGIISNVAPAASTVIYSPYPPAEFAKTAVSGRIDGSGMMISERNKSFHTHRKSNVAKDARAEPERGRTIRNSKCLVFAPSTLAASNSSGGSCEKKLPKRNTPNGIAEATWLIHMPG